jgi:hypothetical protein
MQSAYKRDSTLVPAIILVVPLVKCVYIGLIPSPAMEDTKTKCLILISSGAVLVLSLWTMSYKSEIPELPYNAENKTWFGHRMSQAGEWKHIPITLCATYSFVISYGALVSIIAGHETHVLTIPAFYLAGLLAFYVWHLAAHEWESSELHRIHMRHHQVRYPQNNFYGDSSDDVLGERHARESTSHTMLSLINPFRSTTKTIAHEGPLVVVVLGIVLAGYLCFSVTMLTSVFVLLGFSFMSVFGNAVHKSFHERGFVLEPYAWYRCT